MFSGSLMITSPDVSGTLRVDIGERAYDIVAGRGLVDGVAALIPFSLEGRSCFVVSDENVAPLYAAALRRSLESSGARRVEAHITPPGEESKSFARLEALLGWMLDLGIDRKSVVFALGGGVVGDLAGFAAAVVLRGVPYVQIPTTLLAQVDSAVGGKTAIDMPQGKNLVGAFHQPVLVLSDLAMLDTLPEREMRAGYAEIVKYGLLGDEVFFAWLERGGSDVLRREPASLRHAILESCRAKAAIVKADEREENGLRALLNLGHTFGHAFEAAAGFGGALLHGEAVAIGMVCAFDLSARLGLCPEEESRRARAHLAAAGLPVTLAQVSELRNVAPENFLERMRADKKSTGGRIGFILARGIGKAFEAKDVPEEIVLRSLRASAQGE